MDESKEKILSYRRATWLMDATASLTLERALRDAHKKLQTVADRTVGRGDGQRFVSAKFGDDTKDGVFLHLTADTPGEEASIVPNPKPGSTEIEVGTALPPSENEWMDGDAFLFVSGDHVVLCTTGLRDGSIRSFLQEFLRKSGIRKDADQFDLLKIADMNKIKLLRARGVKEVEIRASMYEATACYSRRSSQAVSLVGAAVKQFKALLNKPNDVTQDTLRVNLTIKTDERFRKSLSLGEKRIEKLAEDLINEQEVGDDFVIHTNDGQRISPSEIYVRSVARIKRRGKSVERDPAFAELVQFYHALQASGALET